MREATGTLSTFRIVIVFTLLFAVFISLSITYNKVIKIKNESLTIIEINEGLTKNSVSILNSYLKNSGYKAKSKCTDGEYGMASLDSDATFTKIDGSSSTKYYYCIRKNTTTDSAGIDKIYYNLKLFYNFEISLFGGVNLMVFNINGETKRLTKYNDLNYIQMDDYS